MDPKQMGKLGAMLDVMAVTLSAFVTDNKTNPQAQILVGIAAGLANACRLSADQLLGSLAEALKMVEQEETPISEDN